MLMLTRSAIVARATIDVRIRKYVREWVRGGEVDSRGPRRTLKFEGNKILSSKSVITSHEIIVDSAD